MVGQKVCYVQGTMKPCAEDKSSTSFSFGRRDHRSQQYVVFLDAISGPGASLIAMNKSGCLVAALVVLAEAKGRSNNQK